MDRVRSSGRLPAPVRVPSSPHPNTNFVFCIPPRISSISGAPSGDREDAGQRSAGDRSRSGPHLLQPPLPGGKGNGRLALCDRPVDSEHLHSTDTVQDGDSSLRLECCPRERSPRLPGLEGRVLPGAGPPKLQEVSALCVTGDSVPVQGSLLWTVHCPPSLHECSQQCQRGRTLAEFGFSVTWTTGWFWPPRRPRPVSMSKTFSCCVTIWGSWSTRRSRISCPYALRAISG